MKELDQQKLSILTELNQPAGKLRTRLVVLWIDGDPSRAAEWAAEHGFPVVVISSTAEDLKAWRVDPAVDTAVFVAESHTVGTVTELTDGGSAQLLKLVVQLAITRANHDHRAIKKWASLVERRNTPPPDDAVVRGPQRTKPAASGPKEIKMVPSEPAASPAPPQEEQIAKIRTLAPAGVQLLVVGYQSDNIVRLELSTGQSTVVAKLATGSRPWSIAVNQMGQVFVGLRGKTKRNVVKLVPGSTNDPAGPLAAVDLTSDIGRFGPGLMAFDRRGLLNVAGGTRRAVLRYNVETGKLIESARLRDANLVGLTLAGDFAYAAEYFQKTILRFDLSADPAHGERLIYKSEHLDRAHGMTIGHNGNLFVSNLQNSLVQEFNSETGEFVRTFLDVRTIGGGKVQDLHFEPRLDHYLLTSGDAVYELSVDGELLAKHQSDSLSGANAIAVVPRGLNRTAAARKGLRSGLIGHATVHGNHVPVALHYQHGQVLQPARLEGSVLEAGRTPRDAKLVFRGYLDVPKRTSVRVFLAGGSSNGGHCRLRVASLEVGPLGDDHEKHFTKEISLEAGSYAIEWTLRGGDFGCGLLKFIDAESSRLLTVRHARHQVPDFPIDQEIQVSSSKPGWPVPASWVDSAVRAHRNTSYLAGRQTSAESSQQLRLRIYQGDPNAEATGTNKLVLDRIITIGRPFEFKGDDSVAAAGLVTRREAGSLHFKGRVTNNAGLLQFDSVAKLGEGVRAYGGGFSGGIIPYFVRLDRVVLP